MEVGRRARLWRNEEIFGYLYGYCKEQENRMYFFGTFPGMHQTLINFSNLYQLREMY